MPSVPDLSQLRKPKADPAPDATESHITFVFPDAQSIDGIKAEIYMVTPEQISVAILNLQRVAMMLLAQRDALAQRAEQEAQAVRANLAKERN